MENEKTIKYLQQVAVGVANADGGNIAICHINKAIAALERQSEPEPRALTVEEVKKRNNQPIWKDLSDGHYRCGIVGRKRVSEDEERFVVGFVYGWEWLEDVFVGGKFYDREPKGE